MGLSGAVSFLGAEVEVEVRDERGLAAREGCGLTGRHWIEIVPERPLGRLGMSAIKQTKRRQLPPNGMDDKH